jgi:hypothetical protein
MKGKTMWKKFKAGNELCVPGSGKTAEGWSKMYIPWAKVADKTGKCGWKAWSVKQRTMTLWSLEANLQSKCCPLEDTLAVMKGGWAQELQAYRCRTVVY